MATGDVDQCESHAPVLLPHTSGYISNTITGETSCGSAHAPWQVTAQPGQRIRLRLIDFTLSSAVTLSGYVRLKSNVCRVYATVKDGSHASSICATETRDALVYTSESHSLQIAIFSIDAVQITSLRFLIYYEGTLSCLYINYHAPYFLSVA